MRHTSRRWLVWLAAATLTGCQSPQQPHPARPAAQAASTAQLVLRSPWARQAMAMPRYTRAQIHHLTLELYTVGMTGETFVQRQTVEADRLDADFVFSGLARRTNYLVKAAAYKAAAETPANRISTEDIGSMTQIAVWDDAAVAVAPLRVQLIDVPVNWGHVVPLPLQGGSLSVPTGALSGAVVDTAGNLYVADIGQGRIARITSQGQVVTHASGLLDPTGVALRPDGGLYVVNASGGSLVEIPAGGGQGVQLNVPVPAQGEASGLALGPDGSLYVAVGQRIFRWRPGELSFSPFAGGGPGSVDGFGDAAGFEEPRGLDVDAAGNLYVVDRSDGSLRRVSPEGHVSTVANGLNMPTDVAVSPDGDLYVATQASSVHAVTPDGQVRLVAGSFGALSGIAADSRGTLYVVDEANQAVRRIF